jgi:predicted O-linked N-acetylglucosamine transferase (SPINDLY family)
LEAIQELVESGRRLHREGKLQDAERVYRQVLDTKPDHAETWQLLGMLAHAAGHPEAAVASIERALAIDPHNPAFHHNLGFVYQASGQHASAVNHFRRAIEISPTSAKTHLLLGQSLLVLSQLDSAIDCLRESIRQSPESRPLRLEAAQALNSFGLSRWQLGRADESIHAFEEASHLAPRSGVALSNLGSVFKQLGRLDDAIATYRQAIEREPVNADFELILGRALQQQGNLAEALRHFEHAATLDPLRSEAFSLQASVHWVTGKTAQALGLARKSVELDAENVPGRHTLAILLHEVGRYAEAESEFREVIRRNAAFPQAHANLGRVLADQGKASEAREQYRAAIQLQPSDRLRVVAGTIIPPICMSTDEINRCRAELSEELNRLYDAGVRVDTRLDVMPTMFYLAYHGLNDRPLLEQLARLSAAPKPEPIRRARRGTGTNEGRIRVGFLSMNLKSHTIGGLWATLIEGLSKTTFDVHILSVGHSDDAIARRVRARADQYVVLPRDVSLAIRAINDQELDVLIFPDIGMDSFTYTLGFNRFAPVQCVMWGHPNTTGLPAIDYFLSSEDLETPESDAYYTEQLVRFSRLTVCYERPERATIRRSRETFGLSESAHVYGCPQSLFKFHPEFDAILKEILTADPDGVLVLIDGQYPHWREMLCRRFDQTLGELCRRIRILPRLSRPEYLDLLAATDVLLDPIHFGGGNSSYEGFALGLPIVTLPSPFLRGRITHALYRQMGLSDWIATSSEDYVRLAVELGTDPERRESARRRILEAGDHIFSDRSATREFEEFLIAKTESQ